MSGVIRHIVNECLRLISEHGLNEQQLDKLVSSLSLELLKLKEGSEWEMIGKGFVETTLETDGL